MQLTDLNFRYNPYTGNQLTHVAGTHFKDSLTGQNVYVNPNPTTAAIIIDDNKQVLLAQRKFDPGRGMWDLPGGFIEVGETVEQGLKRELKEELGADVKTLKYFGSGYGQYVYDQITYPILDTCFIVQLTDEINEFEIGDDVVTTKWVSYHTINYEEIHGETIKTFLKSYFSHN